MRVVNAPRGVDGGRWAPPRSTKTSTTACTVAHLHGVACCLVISSHHHQLSLVRHRKKHRTIHAEDSDRPELGPPRTARNSSRCRTTATSCKQGHGTANGSRERGTRKRPAVLLGVDAAHGTARRKQRAGVVRVPRAGVRCRPSWWSTRRPGQFHALLDACDFPFSFTLDACDLSITI